ncbi:MAG: alpha/beta hydrolase [Gammaproteobacteria bacterium]|nr:alpha/beta hydrolase [Gammaproteobacteria bacterium]
MIWTVPEPLAVAEARMDDGTAIVLRRHGKATGPRLVLSHANGFAADAYYPFWALLAEKFDIVVYDLRNHGWNTVGPIDAHAIPTFVRDNASIARAIDAHFGAKPRIGVFHSVSGQVAAIEASAAVDAYAALVLFDPFICPPGCDPGDRELLRSTLRQLAEGARRRRTVFETKAAYAERLERTPAFEQLREGVADLLAQTTLRPTVDGTGEELRCPREYEARIYEQGFEFAASVDLETLACPVKVIGSDPATPHTFLPTVSMRELLALDYDFVPETSHFLQLEEPEECAATAMQFIAEAVPDTV